MPSLDSLTSALSNPAVGNFFLLLAAIIGVSGSYWLQEHQRRIRKSRLRRALIAEIESMQPAIKSLDHLYLEDYQQYNSWEHPELFLSNNVYDSNTQNIGDLTNEEVTAVVEFYSAASKAQGAANRNAVNAFTEVSNRRVYAKLLNALAELSSNVDGFRPNIDDFDEPRENIRKDSTPVG